MGGLPCFWEVRLHSIGTSDTELRTGTDKAGRAHPPGNAIRRRGIPHRRNFTADETERHGGSRLVAKFANGLPITGPQSQCSVYEDDDAARDRLRRSHLFGKESSRSRERVAESGHSNAHPIWARICNKLRRGGQYRRPPYLTKGSPSPGFYPATPSDSDSDWRRRISCERATA